MSRTGHFQMSGGIQTEPQKLRVRLLVKHPQQEWAVWEALRKRLRGYLADQGVTRVSIEKARKPPQLTSIEWKVPAGVLGAEAVASPCRTVRACAQFSQRPLDRPDNPG